MRANRWSVKLLVLALVGLLVALAACQAAPAPTPTAAPKTEKPAAPKAEATAAPAGKAEPAKAATLAAAAPKAEKPEVTQVKIGTLPISAFTPLFTAEKLGFYKAEGLEVELVRFGGGAEMLPAMQSGRLHFGASNYVSAILAVNEGFDFALVSNFEIGQTTPPDLNCGMWVLKESLITELKQLEGKRVAVNNINSLGWLTVRAAVKKAGGDPEKVQFAELPYPQIPDAITNKQVDAGWTPSPFSVAMNESGKVRNLSWVCIDVQPKMPLVGVFGIGTWVKQNPITTKKVVNAISKGIEATNKSEAEGRKLIAEYTKMDPALASKIPFHVWTPTLDMQAIQTFADIMYDNKMLKQKFDASKLVAR